MQFDTPAKKDPALTGDIGPAIGIPKLLDYAQRQGKNVRVLAEMLWRIRAHPQLPGFIRICQHIHDILTLRGDDCAFIEAHPEFTTWMPLLDWILEESETLANECWSVEQSGHRARFLSTLRGNPVSGQGAKKHRLYCLLWDDGPLHPSSRERFRILQSHVLVAHAAILKHERQLIETGGEPHENLNGRLYSPSMYCWRFQQDRNPWRSAIDRLPNRVKTSTYINALTLKFRLSSEDFVDALNIAEEKDLRTANDVPGTVARIIWFLRWGASPSSFRWITHTPSLKGKGVGSSGCDDDEDDKEFSVPLDDPDDPESTGGQLHVHSTWKGSLQHKRALLEADEHPGENGPRTMIELADDETAAGITRAGAPEKANQLLPWSLDNLSAIEIARTLRGLANIRPAEISEVEGHELRTLAECMLWTGLSFTQALSLTVSSLISKPMDSDVSIFIDSDPSSGATSAVWHINALTPPYRSLQAAVSGDRLREKFIEFVDFGGAHQLVLRFLENSAATSYAPTRHEASEPAPKKIFLRDPDWYKRKLKSLLKAIDETGRITPGRLSRVLFQRIVECSGGDITVAAIITRTDHYLASARIFYATPSATSLVSLHRMATERLLAELKQAGWTRAVSLPKVPPRTDYSVGSRLCPTMESTKEAIALLKSKFLRQVQLIDEKHGTVEFVAKHNWYSLYSVWMQMFCVGTRGILTPYVHLSEFDEEKHLATIADKDSGNNYKRRLIWVPDLVWEQMENYDTHLQFAHKVRGLPKPSAGLPCYFVRQRKSGKLLPVKIRPATIKEFAAKIFPFPANFPRRFVRTELLEANCKPGNPPAFEFPPQFADCWMGHHFRGEEPWGPYSSFSYSNYLRQLNSFYGKALKELGFEPIPMEPTA